MSLSALKKAFYERAAGVETLIDDALAAQEALGALLTTDPDTDLPAVLDGNKSVIPLFDSITFMEAGGTPDNRFGEDTGGIGDVILDVYIWSRSARSSRISDIHNLVDRLFNERRGIAPLLRLGDGRIFHMEALTGLSTVYDRDNNAWMGYSRYRFILAHY
jgi:hypothetical protein